MIITILAPCAPNREKLCAVPLPKRKSKKQTLHWKKLFHIRILGEEHPFSNFGVRSVDTQLHQFHHFCIVG